MTIAVQARKSVARSYWTYGAGLFGLALAGLSVFLVCREFLSIHDAVQVVPSQPSSP